MFEYITLSYGLYLIRTEILVDKSQSRHTHTIPMLKLSILYHVPAQMSDDKTETHYLSHYRMVLINTFFAVAYQLHEKILGSCYRAS